MIDFILNFKGSLYAINSLSSNWFRILLIVPDIGSIPKTGANSFFEASFSNKKFNTNHSRDWATDWSIDWATNPLSLSRARAFSNSIISKNSFFLRYFSKLGFDESFAFIASKIKNSSSEKFRAKYP